MRQKTKKQSAPPYDAAKVELAGGEASVDPEKLRSLARLVLGWMRDKGADVAHQGDERLGGGGAS